MDIPPGTINPVPEALDLLRAHLKRAEEIGAHIEALERRVNGHPETPPTALGNDPPLMSDRGPGLVGAMLSISDSFGAKLVRIDEALRSLDATL